MTLICGVDEAGKGCVIGPLVVGAVCFEDKKLDLATLRKLNVKDSKLLTPEQRSDLFGKIQKLCDKYDIAIIPADEIDSRNATGVNLVLLEAIKIASMLDKLQPELCYVDSPTSPRAERFAELIKGQMKNKNIYIVAEHKGESKHIEVAAASIIAKVTRDAEVEKIRKEVGIEFGSGYTSDPITVGFVEKHWDNTLSKYIRHSWGTIKDLKKLKGQTKLKF